MPNWLDSFIGSAYKKIPIGMRPVAKATFLWVSIRAEALFRWRPIREGRRVLFVDHEIADIEAYEFLGPGRGEIGVTVEASVVSPGTENAVLCGLPGARRSFPYYPGYSCVAKVDEIGSNVEGVSVGDRVAGRIGHCSHATANSQNMFIVPDSVPAKSACFIEIGIIALQGIRKARINPGDRVVVLGQGIIGQLCNRLAKSLGASEVIAVATSRRREATATSNGGADRFVVLNDPADAESLGADIVLEAVGAPSAIGLSMRCARIGGRVALIGSARGLAWNFSIRNLIQQRNIEVVGAHISAMPSSDNSLHRWTYQEEGQLFLRLLEEELLSVDELITWIACPDEANAVFECLAGGGGSQVGIVLDWNGQAA